MYGKHIVALGLGALFRCNDSELPDEMEDRQLPKILGYRETPDKSIFSKFREGSWRRKIGKVAELIIQELYRNRVISLMAIDSTSVSYYFEYDKEATFGYVTLKKKEMELLKVKGKKGLKRGTNCMLYHPYDYGSVTRFSTNHVKKH